MHHLALSPKLILLQCKWPRGVTAWWTKLRVTLWWTKPRVTLGWSENKGVMQCISRCTELHRGGESQRDGGGLRQTYAAHPQQRAMQSSQLSKSKRHSVSQSDSAGLSEPVWLSWAQWASVTQLGSVSQSVSTQQLCSNTCRKNVQQIQQNCKIGTKQGAWVGGSREAAKHHTQKWLPGPKSCNLTQDNNNNEHYEKQLGMTASRSIWKAPLFPFSQFLQPHPTRNSEQKRQTGVNKWQVPVVEGRQLAKHDNKSARREHPWQQSLTVPSIHPASHKATHPATH